MASEHQIHRAFQDLGGLFAAEHEEQDDHGAGQVHKMIRRLRKFAAREQVERDAHAPDLRLQEAEYDLADGRKVWFDAGDALRDATDLYTVLEEDHGTGSPNLENTQARDIVNKLQQGGGLGEVHIGTLRKLLAKHQSRIGLLRRSRDRDGQDMLEMASDGPDSRIIDPDGRN